MSPSQDGQCFLPLPALAEGAEGVDGACGGVEGVEGAGGGVEGVEGAGGGVAIRVFAGMAAD